MKLYGKSLNKKFAMKRKQELGLTLNQIAVSTGLTVAYIKKLLYQKVDKPSQDTFGKLSDIFECKLNDLRNEKELPFDSEIMQECTTIIHYHVKHGSLDGVSNQRLFDITEGLYNYAISRKLENKTPYIDETFVDWFVGYMSK